MIGAIIGDLAAWTWENNHEKFYLSLISEKALLSEYGLSVLATADALDFNLFMNEAEYQEYIRSWFRVVNDGVVCYSEGFKKWIEMQNYRSQTQVEEGAQPATLPLQPTFLNEILHPFISTNFDYLLKFLVISVKREANTYN